MGAPETSLPSAILSGAFIWTQRSDSNTSRNVTIVTPATHDTASAVVAVPAEAGTSGTAHAYISSGTWSLLGVESTARAAAERNYHVAFAVDAMTDLVASAHANSLDVIFPRRGQVDTTDRIIAALDA